MIRPTLLLMSAVCAIPTQAAFRAGPIRIAPARVAAPVAARGLMGAPSVRPLQSLPRPVLRAPRAIPLPDSDSLIQSPIPAETPEFRTAMAFYESFGKYADAESREELLAQARKTLAPLEKLALAKGRGEPVDPKAVEAVRRESAELLEKLSDEGYLRMVLSFIIGAEYPEKEGAMRVEVVLMNARSARKVIRAWVDALGDAPAPAPSGERDTVLSFYKAWADLSGEADVLEEATARFTEIETLAGAVRAGLPVDAAARAKAVSELGDILDKSDEATIRFVVGMLVEDGKVAKADEVRVTRDLIEKARASMDVLRDWKAVLS